MKPFSESNKSKYFFPSLLLGSILVLYNPINTSAQSSQLPNEFFGTYVSNLSSDTYWTINSDGTGKYSAGFYGSSPIVTPITYEVMLNSDGHLSEAKQDGNTGYVLKVYWERLDERVRKEFKNSEQDAENGMVIIWFNDKEMSLQFMLKLNAWYQKNGGYIPNPKPEVNRQDAATGTTNSNNSINDTTNNVAGATNTTKSTQLDFWGNPVKTESNTVNYGGMEVEDNAHYQQQMQQRQNSTYASEQHKARQAEIIEEVNYRNNATYDQAYEIAARDVNREFDDAKKQLNTGSGDALINSSVALSRSATNSAQATTGAIGFGVGVALKASENAAKRKAAQEAREERERQQKAEEARIAAAKAAMKNARLNVFKAYPPGELPLSSTQSNGKNLYYFVYSYTEADLQNLEVDIFLSNIFAVGKYPDGTWPLQTKLADQINALTPLEEVICGPFYTLSEANGVYASFSGRLHSTGMKAKQVDYGGFNAHAETAGDMPAATPKLDFWGNPIKD